MASPTNDFPLGGRLKFFKAEWAEASRWQRNVISRGLRWRFARPPPALGTFSLPEKHSEGAEKLLQKFLSQKVIKQCNSPKFLSRVFTVPKANGKERLILDLSRLNQFLEPPKFFLPNLRTLKGVLQRGSLLGKIDLTAAYLHCPINSLFQGYLAFPWQGKFFTFTALPFGLCVAPAVFQGLINHPLGLCRAQGFQCLGYLDDLLVIAQSKEQCQKGLRCLQSHLGRLGFLINHEKFQLFPSQQLEWLGALIDAKDQNLSLPQAKVSKIVGMASSFLASRRTDRPDWESFLGQLAFASQIGPELTLRKKLLGPILSLLPSREGSIPLPSETLQALEWWATPGNLSQWFPFHSPAPSVLLWTNACEAGWGGHDQHGNWVAGCWDLHESSLHMNILELKAVFHSLHSSLTQEGSSVRVFSDNSTTVQCLLKHGSSRSLAITREVQAIFHLCEEKNLAIHPHKIPGKLNVLADALSRNTALPGEWELHPQDRSRILSAFPELQVDLMATPWNAILRRFVCPFLHPEAEATDAWTVDWKRWEHIYLFPPPSQVLKVLENLHLFRGTMTLILRDHPYLAIPQDLPRPLIKAFSLLWPPQQKVRGVWQTDGRHKSSPWTVFRY